MIRNKTSILFTIRKYIYLVPLTFFLIICNSSCNSSKNKNTVQNAIETIQLPDPAPLAESDVTRIQNFCSRWYDSALKSTRFNGGMIVAKKGNIVFERYNGTAHIPGEDKIDSATSMHIASISKTFTAMAILKLWQDNKLNIDDEVSKYLPLFSYPGVTIRSLLSHRSGLPNYVHYMDMINWDKNKMVSNEDILETLTDKKYPVPPAAAPNTRFEYCNTNFALLALIIEKVSGKKFKDFMNDTFFIPLQMKHTFVYSASDSGKVPLSYDWRDRLMPLNNLDNVYGDKNVYTTPRDLLIWDRALYSGKIFKSETLDQAFKPYSNERPGIKNYGLGWRMNVYPNGKKVIYHNGWWHGSNAVFIRLIQDSATIILIGNKFDRNIYHAKDLANIFADYYTGKEEDDVESSKQNEGNILPQHKNDATSEDPENYRESLLKEALQTKKK